MPNQYNIGMNYIKFRENNDWEGETWCFYIPVEGNEGAISQLRNKIDDETASGAYSLTTEPIPEEEVDTLVKHAEMGYMAEHNKLAGKLEVPDVTMVEMEELLYKGGIEGLMK